MLKMLNSWEVLTNKIRNPYKKIPYVQLFFIKVHKYYIYLSWFTRRKNIYTQQIVWSLLLQLYTNITSTYTHIISVLRVLYVMFMLYQMKMLKYYLNFINTKRPLIIQICFRESLHICYIWIISYNRISTFL